MDEIESRHTRRSRRRRGALIVLVHGASVISTSSALKPKRLHVIRRSRTRSHARTRKPGNPATEWDVSGGGSTNIEGFATDISVDQGQTVQFKVDTNSSNYRIDIYRLGYYGGMGARKFATVQPVGAASAEPAKLPHQRRRPVSSTAATGRSRRPGPSLPTPSPASTSASSSARTARRARTTSRSSSAMTTAAPTCCSRPPTRPGRRTTSTAGTASTRGAPTAARTKSATTGPSPRARVATRTGCSTPSTR